MLGGHRIEGVMSERTARQHRGPRLRPAALIGLVAALAGATVSGVGGLPRAALAEAPQPAPVIVATPLPDLVTFYGRGLGHGVGLSQYGARGRALAGQDAPTILAHYYQGTTLAQVDPATPVRVLVLSRWQATEPNPLEITGAVTPWTVDGVAATFPPDARLRLAWSTVASPVAWHLTVTAADGGILSDGPAPAAADLVIRPSSPDGRLRVASKATRFSLYRGNLHLVLAPGSSRVSVVNEVGLDTYLGGVVPVEMPSTWPAAALQAQSIAARSYVARRLHPATSFYDVPDSAASQIYRGVLAEKPATNAAIAATAGQVLMSGSSIIDALFDSTGGGATESNENVYTTATGRVVVRPVGYLRGSSDRAPDGTAYDASSPYATWSTRTYARTELSAWFAGDSRTNVGDLVALDLHDRGVSGRLISVTLIGTAGTKRVSGEVFRAVFNKARPTTDPSLRSTLLDLAPIP
jgi:stage II sporulation protein D